MTQQSMPQWQPSGKVFLVGTMIDGMLEGAQEQDTTLLEARPALPLNCPKDPHLWASGDSAYKLVGG